MVAETLASVVFGHGGVEWKGKMCLSVECICRVVDFECGFVLGEL